MHHLIEHIMGSLNVVICGFLLMTTLIILALAYFSQRRREVPGALPFAFLCLVTAFYTAGYGMELNAQTISQVDFWNRFQYLGLPFMPAIWVALAIDYTGIKSRYHRDFYFILFIVPVLTIIFRLTSHIYPLYYGEMQLVSNGYFLVLDFAKGPWYFVHMLFFIVCAAYAFRLYRQDGRRSAGYLAQQARIMAVVSSFPVLAVIMNALEINPFGLDSGPLFVIFVYLLFTYGIFNYRLMHLIPLSRQSVFDSIRDGVLVLDPQGRLMDYNAAAGRIFPRLSRNSAGQDCASCLDSYPTLVDTLAKWQEKVAGITAGGGTEPAEEGCQMEISQLDKEQKKFYQVRLAPLFEKDQLLGSTVLISDITRQTEMMRQLEQTARTDGLTGLMNRTYFMDRMEYEICRSIRLSGAISLILMDIDYYKLVNDKWGHQAGDYVLREIAARITGKIRTVDLVGRYGGEEFIFFLPDTGQEQAVQVAERLRREIADGPITWNGQTIPLTASFGIAAVNLSREQGKIDCDTLIGRADEALYRAKRSGRNRVEAWSGQPAADAC